MYFIMKIINWDENIKIYRIELKNTSLTIFFFDCSYSDWYLTN